MEQINILVDILQGVKDLHTWMSDLTQELKKKQEYSLDAYESHEVDKISEAFAQAQMDYMPILKNCEIAGKAYSFEYASLDQILNVIRPSLSKYGLSFHQFTKETPEKSILMLHSRLRHASGQWFESRMRVIPTGDTIQALGAALTYYRRYSILLILGHHPEDEDSDGLVGPMDVDARKRSVEKFVKADPVKMAMPTPKGYERISKRELEDLEEELKSEPEMCERMMKSLGIRTLSDMAQEDYRPIISKIRDFKSKLGAQK